MSCKDWLSSAVQFCKGYYTPCRAPGGLAYSEYDYRLGKRGFSYDTSDLEAHCEFVELHFGGREHMHFFR